MIRPKKTLDIISIWDIDRLVHIISWKKIADFIVEYPNSESSLRSWYKLIKNENYSNFSDFKMVFRSADQVWKYTVFNRVVAKLEIS